MLSRSRSTHHLNKLGTNVGPISPMLHTKSKGHRPSGSGEDGFLKDFTIYERGSYLGHVTKTYRLDFG